MARSASCPSHPGGTQQRLYVSPGTQQTAKTEKTKDETGGTRHGRGSRPKKDDLVKWPPHEPGEWMYKLREKVSQPMDSAVADNPHRHYWFHPSTIDFPLGKVSAPTNRGPEAAEGRLSATGIGMKPKVYGSYKSGYGIQNMGLEKHYKLKNLRDHTVPTDEDHAKTFNCKDIQKSKYFGSLSHLTFVTELNRRGLNPGLTSEGVTASMVGGKSTHLEHTVPEGRTKMPSERCVGLYEDSWKHWKGQILPPKHGLCTSDVTQFADEAAMQKNLMRK